MLLQPVSEISEAVRGLKRGKGETSRILVHTDAAQAIGKIPVDVTDLDVDYLTVVGHKVSLANMNIGAHRRCTGHWENPSRRDGP